ncbi:hypothetical protein BH24ACT16_BH24ACT16_04830 [soil metagenome]
MDPPENNRAMVEKLALPFSLISDPEGELAGRCGVWNEDEGVAEPAIVVLDPSNEVRYAYTGGRDFSDRPAEDEVISALDEANVAGNGASGEPEIQVTANGAEESTVRPERRPMPLESLRPYYLGAYFTSIALKKRIGDNEDGQKVDEYREQVERYTEAVRQTLKMKG